MKKTIIAVALSLSVFLGVGSVMATSIAQAQNISIQQLVQLFISLGIIPADKAAAAQAAIAGTSSSSCYSFNTNLGIGSSGTDVSSLQNILSAQGVYSASADGTFDEDVAAAVVQFQARVRH